MIYLIDNYDSFSYNLYQLIGEVDPAIEVLRNDALTVEELEEKNPEAVILSPGPGRPADAGICEEVALKLSGSPYLGRVLGASGHMRGIRRHGGVCQGTDAR